MSTPEDQLESFTLNEADERAWYDNMFDKDAPDGRFNPNAGQHMQLNESSQKLQEITTMDAIPGSVASILMNLKLYPTKRDPFRAESAGADKTRYYVALMQKGLYGKQVEQLVKHPAFNAILTMNNDDRLWVSFQVDNEG